MISLSLPPVSRPARFLPLLLAAAYFGSAGDTSAQDPVTPSPSPPKGVITLRGTSNAPAMFSVVAPTFELSRSASVLTAEAAEALLKLPEVTVAHFKVEADTAAEAIAHAIKSGYFDTTADGVSLRNRSAGHTSWRLEWKVNETNQEVILRWGAFVVMPEWNGPPDSANGRVDQTHERKQWKDFDAHLRIHEAHHVQGVVETISNAIKKFQALDRNAPDFSKQVNAVGQEAVAEINGHDRNIDQMYGHQ